MNQRQRQQVQDLYAQGYSTRYIAKYFGIGKTTVLGILKRRGVKMRPRGNQNS